MLQPQNTCDFIIHHIATQPAAQVHACLMPLRELGQRALWEMLFPAVVVVSVSAVLQNLPKKVKVTGKKCDVTQGPQRFLLMQLQELWATPTSRCTQTRDRRQVARKYLSTRLTHGHTHVVVVR